MILGCDFLWSFARDRKRRPEQEHADLLLAQRAILGL